MDSTDMEMKYTVKGYAFDGIATTYKTQAELAQLLQEPWFRLISVNDTGGQYYFRRKKRKKA